MELTNETLDPSNWAEFSKLAHRMIDDMTNYLSGLSDRPAWKQIPDEAKYAIQSELPESSEGFEATYESFRKNILPYPNGNLHPRFWGWVQGTGTPFAMMADMLASGMNPHMAGFNQAPAYVEETVIEWLKELMGFPEDSSGLLTSGGTMANLTGLAVARNSSVDFDFREEGFFSERSPKLVAYASSETHKWAKESMELLGFGSRLLRIIDIDDNYRINTELLKEQIREDRENGFTPFCIIGNCGTVNTGAIDDLKALGTLARNERMWFHIDGAFGALTYINDRYSNLVEGLDMADSVAFDLHKWMYLPFEVGCVLVRRAGMQTKTFGSQASYLEPTGRGVCSGKLKFADLGIELTRGFKALKVWMSFKAHGLDRFRTLIGQNIEHIRYFAKLVEESSYLKVMAPVPLNVVCFRYEIEHLDENVLDEINREILLQLQEKGIAVPSGTVIKGKFSLRIANVNHRSKAEDFELLVRETERLGKSLANKEGSS